MPPLATALIDLPAQLQSALALGLVSAALFTLLAFVLVGLQIWSILKPKTDIYVTRLEFEALKNEVKGEIEKNRLASNSHFTELATQVNGVQQTMQVLSNDVMRAIGRLEGASEHKEAA
jgi:methyl-accepting chemotaxis protein